MMEVLNARPGLYLHTRCETRHTGHALQAFPPTDPHVAWTTCSLRTVDPGNQPASDCGALPANNHLIPKRRRRTRLVCLRTVHSTVELEVEEDLEEAEEGLGLLDLREGVGMHVTDMWYLLNQ